MTKATALNVSPHREIVWAASRRRNPLDAITLRIEAVERCSLINDSTRVAQFAQQYAIGIGDHQRGDVTPGHAGECRGEVGVGAHRRRSGFHHVLDSPILGGVDPVQSKPAENHIVSIDHDTDVVAGESGDGVSDDVIGLENPRGVRLTFGR